jgi:hypothetical protein
MSKRILVVEDQPALSPYTSLQEAARLKGF